MRPKTYSLDGYTRWHDAVVEPDRPILERLGKLRDQMMVEARPDLDTLHNLLSFMRTHARNEYERTRKQKIDYQIALSDSLRSDSGGDTSRYEELFKTVPSIVNKMWRKADDSPRVVLSDIRRSITDLIRTDIRAETLDSARLFADYMNNLRKFLYIDKLQAEFDERVESVSFEPEMKMASGYFAYHGLVRFKSGHVVEVQIYSALMSEWRKLSHQLYERVRLEPITQHEFASPEARLISLGHALHLAECEIMRLRQEIDGRK